MKSGRSKKTGDPRPGRKTESGKKSRLPQQETSGHRLAWRFTHVDDDGPWGLSRLAAAEVARLAAAMTSFESMTVHALFSGHPGKDYDLDDLPSRTARRRLAATGLADVDQISRLRVSATGRLYGFRVDNVFHILWWDPNHEVWPARA